MGTMKKNRNLFLILAIVFTVVFCGWATLRIVKYVQFNLGCEAYLKRAADSNTIELAKGELTKAIDYIEQNNLTDGIVSIFLKNPANDMGFWHTNIKSAYDELNNLPEDASQLEKTNVLMKLRESLTDRDDNGGTKVIFPQGLEIYPNNAAYFWLAALSCAALCLFWTLFGIAAGIQAGANFQMKVTTITRKPDDKSGD